MKFVLLFLSLCFALRTWSLGAMEGNDNKQQEQLNKALYHAAERGDVNSLKQLLAQGAHAEVIINDPSVLMLHDCTALMRAAAMGHAECLRILIENGGDMSFKNAAGASALSVAFEGHQFNCIYVLFDAAIEIPIRNFMKSNNLGFVDKFAALPESLVKMQLKKKIMLLLCARKYKIGDFSRIPKPLIVMIGEDLTKEIVTQSKLDGFHPTKLLYSQLPLIFQIIDYLHVLVEKIDEMGAMVAEVAWVNHRVIINTSLKEYKQLINLKMVYSKLKNKQQKSEALSRLLLKSQKLFCTNNDGQKSTCHIF